ncbi:MAG: hypothetical protein FWD60_13825 [Candidatus Azobacteroides sp.]|nr:hypothetical protein [Candidatus Azobacteroides sp.]
METNFLEFKKEILKRAKTANACVIEYKRAYYSESFSELMQVIKENFDFACFKKVIDSELIKLYENQFNENKIYCNVDISEGFLLASGSVNVKASGSANVKAWDNANVEAWDNVNVEAWDNANVKAWDNANVEAWDNVNVEAWDNANVKAWGSVNVEAWDNANVKAWGSVNVEAWDNAYVTSYSTIECKLSENAIYRIRKTNTIRYASDDIKFEKV